MKAQQRRAAWERKVAGKYGIDMDRNTEFLNKVWEDAGKSFADFEDFDAYVESAWSYYSLSKEQPESAGSNGGFGESSESNEDFGRRLQGGGDKGLEDSEVKLDDDSKARIAAFSEYLAKIAATDPRMMRVRERICGGLRRTIPPEKARKFLEEHSIPGNEEVEGSVESLWWPGGSSHGRHFRVLKGSILGELQRAAAYLEKRYPWTDDQAAYFILCGGVPQAATIHGWHTASTMKGVAAHKYNRTTIKLEVESWVPSELVRKAYCQLQRELHGERNNRRPSSRNVEVFRFVLDQSKINIVNTGEYLARLELPPWRQMLESWNKQFSEGDPRRYSDVRNFRRDFDRGQQAVIGTEWGLPGTPDQPISADEARKEARERKERLITALKAHREKYGNTPLSQR
jgi:hypothetical protein